MLYYQSKSDKRMVDPKTRRVIDPAFVKNELYTETELRRYCQRLALDFDKVTEQYFDKRYISKQKIHWFFGCRFADINDMYGD